MKKTGPDGQAGDAAGVWRYAPIVLIVAGIAIGYGLGWHRYLSFDTLGDSRDLLRDRASREPLLAPLSFMLIFAASVALSVPVKPVLTVFGSVLFGFLPGALYSLVAAVVGATTVFLAVRAAFGGILSRRAGSSAALLASGFRDNAFFYLLALRFAPIVPSSVVNITAAVADVRPATFVAATTIGTIPAVAAYAWLGEGLDSALAAAREQGRVATPYDLLTPQTTLALVALSLLALLPALVRKRRAGS